MGALSCTTCRMIRRFMMAFAAGGFAAWYVTGTLPTDPESSGMWRAFLLVAVVFAFLNVFARMRQMRAAFRR